MRRHLHIFGLVGLIALIVIFNYSSNVVKGDERGIVEKEKKAKQFDRPDLAIQQNIEMTMDPALGYPPVSRSVKAFEEIKRNAKYRTLSNESIWIERGPNNVGGRTRSLMFDPNDPNSKKVWAGAIGGGLWFNNDITDASQSWSNVDDFLVNLAISAMAYDPSNTSTFYVSTGLGYTNDIIGAGIFKSIDGGGTWSQLSSTDNSTFELTQDLVVDENGVVYVSTYDGVMKSTDGGTSWSNILSGQAGDLEIASDGTIYATFGIGSSAGSIHKSTNDGATWTEITPESGGLRTELAVSSSNPNVIYAVADGGSGSQDVRWMYRSNDAGSTWTEISIPRYVEQNCSVGTNHYTRGQAFFDLILAIHPTDPDKVIAGGIDLHVSSDGGTNWTGVSYWTGSFCDAYVHADQHAIVFRPNYPNEAIFGNDGGVFYSSDIGVSENPNFQQRVRGYNVTTFYSAAASNVSGGNHFLAGAQDNGTQLFSQALLNNTRQATGGDGAYCFVDQDNPNIQISSFVFNTYFLSQDGGKSFSSISNNQTLGRFINPTEYDSDSDILYAAGGLNQMTKITGLSSTPSSQTIINLSIDNRQITHIKASPHTANRLFVGVRINGGEGKIYRIDNADQTSPTVTEITGSYSGSHGGWVSSIDVGGTDNHLIATFSNYGVNSVYESTDGGNTWENKEGNLPDIPVRWGLFNPNNRNQVLIATELGVWSTEDITIASPDWQPTNIGLANVRTDMLKIRSADNLLIAATFGRGLFTSDILSSGAVANFVAPTVGYVNVPLNFKDASIKANNDWSWTFGDGNVSSIQNPSNTYTNPGVYTVSLSVDGETSTESKTNYITILPRITPPYLVADGGNFESNQSHFSSQSLFNNIDLWEVGIPAYNLNNAPSGTNVWKTNLDGELSDPGIPFSCALYTPAFDLTAPGDYSLKFNLEMETVYCNAPSALQVQYTLDNGVNWTTLGSTYPAFGVSNWYNRGDNTGCSIDFDLFPEKAGWAINTSGPLAVEHSLNKLAGNDAVAFRIVYAQSTGSGPNSSGADPYEKDGVLIDDFEITLSDPSASFTAPNFGYKGTEIAFIFESTGATSYSWDFGDGTTSDEENPKHSYSEGGVYEVELAITSLAGSDIKSKSVLILPNLNTPYDLADGGNLEVNQNHFHAENVSGTPFELGNSSIVGKDGTNSGSNAWVTGLSDDGYLNNTEAYIYTPVFDFLSLGEYTLSFFANFELEDNWDGFIVEYSTNLGQTWRKLNPKIEQGWYNQFTDGSSPVFPPGVPFFSGETDGYQEFSTDLSFLAGSETISLRFKFLTDGAATEVGLAIDDISVDGPEPGPGIPAFSIENNSGCDGQVVTFINESTGSISSFEWDFGNNANPSSAMGPGPHEVTYSGSGSSTVTLTTTSPINGIVEKQEVDIINLSPAHEPSLSSVYNNNGTYTLKASSGDSYQWLRNGEVIDGETGRTILVDLGDGGEFSVLVTIGSCEVEAEGLIVNSVLENSLVIYPNPVKNVIRLESELEFNGDFSIYSQAGSLVMTGNLDKNKTSIDVSELQNGIYVLRMNANEETFVKRVIIRK